MKSTMGEMEAIAVSEPSMRFVMHPEKGELVEPGGGELSAKIVDPNGAWPAGLWLVG